MPQGTYDKVRVQATVTISYDGPNDVKVTVVGPGAVPRAGQFAEVPRGRDRHQYFSEDNGKTWEFVPRTPINS